MIIEAENHIVGVVSYKLRIHLKIEVPLSATWF